MHKNAFLLSALCFASLFVMPPITANAQSNGITSFKLCQPGQPGCEAGTSSGHNQEQKIRPGYYLPAPGGVNSGGYSNELPRQKPLLRNISCKQGKKLLRQKGYKKVRAIYCIGPFYTFRARASGKSYVITIRRSNGKIVNRYKI